MTSFASFTPSRAEQLKELTTRDTMRIEAQMRGMVERITDVSWMRRWTGDSPENILEQVRLIESDLHEIIDRRTEAKV